MYKVIFNDPTFIHPVMKTLPSPSVSQHSALQQPSISNCTFRKHLSISHKPHSKPQTLCYYEGFFVCVCGGVGFKWKALAPVQKIQEQGLREGRKAFFFFAVLKLPQASLPRGKPPSVADFASSKCQTNSEASGTLYLWMWNHI